MVAIRKAYACANIHTNVATRSGHLDYPGHLGHWSKWVLPEHTNMPDPDQKHLVIMYIKNCNKRSIFSNRAVTNISFLNLLKPIKNNIR